MPPRHIHLETTTTATSLTAGRVRRGWGDILDSANLHSGTSESAESGLGSWAGGLGAVACSLLSASGLPVWAVSFCLTSSGTDLDVQSVDAQLLAADGHVLSCQHCSVWGGLVSVRLDLHSSGDTGDSFTTATIAKSATKTSIFMD
jgi:hypothetical protein